MHNKTASSLTKKIIVSKYLDSLSSFKKLKTYSPKSLISKEKVLLDTSLLGSQNIPSTKDLNCKSTLLKTKSMQNKSGFSNIYNLKLVKQMQKLPSIPQSSQSTVRYIPIKSDNIVSFRNSMST